VKFSSKIIRWYKTNKRDLPWRKTKDPYKIWLSEIILQQTQVKQGLPYYEKFVSVFPTVKDLANSTEEKVLNLWQGLGYYSRGRNLHFSAKYVTKELCGEFPNSKKDLLKLKGVGDYTASAIASFAFDEKVAPVDGNVIRVISRVFGIVEDVSDLKTLKKIKELAASLLPKTDTYTYNQGMMEFGALQCKPKSPNCEVCPFNIECVAKTKELVNTIPFKDKKIKVKNRCLNYLVFTYKDTVLIKQRTDKDIWQNLHDFPLLESYELLNFDDDKILLEIDKLVSNSDVKSISVSEDFKHKLSHQKLFVRFFKIELNKEFRPKFENQKVVGFKALESLGKPILIQNYLNTYIL